MHHVITTTYTCTINSLNRTTIVFALLWYKLSWYKTGFDCIFSVKLLLNVIDCKLSMQTYNAHFNHFLRHQQSVLSYKIDR